MIGQDELKKQQEYQELDLLKKFYDFACQCKSKENKDDKHEVEFDCGSSGKLKFNYDSEQDNLIPTDNIDNIDLTSQPIFCCLGGFFIMLSQEKDRKTNKAKTAWWMKDDDNNSRQTNQYAIREEEEKNHRLSIGDRVENVKFGKGTIRGVYGKFYEVKFDTGETRVLNDIQKIEE